MSPSSPLFAKEALLPEGWRRDVVLEVDEQGQFSGVRPDSPPLAGTSCIRLAGPVLPGLVNLHAHAFQRAMAGLAERSSAGASDAGDNFWTWREVMYRFLERLDPDDIEAIATWLYIELVRCGYTSVVEFHYLHHAPDGQPYADRAELSLRILRAADRAGIAVTLLPVLYAHGGFGGAPPKPGQRRFLHDLDGYARLLDDLSARLGAWPLARLGVAPHSLRAVTPHELGEAIAMAARLSPVAPIHLHVAEQESEVAACQAVLGETPITWLLDHAPVDGRFCIVHATHMTKTETEGLARSKAVVGLCPTTEANLGDGIFAAAGYLAHGGRFGVGSDSNVGVDPFVELQLLEYGQRLLLRRRNVLSGGEGQSVGGTLFREALKGGAQAAAQPTSQIAVGARADLVVLDGEHPSLVHRQGDALLDAAIFAPSTSLRGPVRDVMVGGRFVVRDRRHASEESAAIVYRDRLRRLLD